MAFQIPLRNCATAWALSAFADEAGESAGEQVKAMAAAGIRRVVVRAVEGHNVAALPVDVAREARGRFDEAGLTVAMLGSPIGKIDIADDLAIDLEKLAHLGLLAEVLGCKAVRIFSYYNKQNQPAARWEAEAMHRLGRLKDLAGELGLTLYYENEKHIWGDRAETVRKIAGLRDERFKVIFDFDNYNQAGQDVWQTWLALRDVTDAFHLKDSDTERRHVPVGEGVGRVRDILVDAMSRGWAGPVSLEPHLRHSQAVIAAGRERAGRKYADLPAAECFHVAAEAALGVLGSIKATVV